jgi:predicted unusual protein kinase regulating ubiquinone biosynthesis (AarF/ABC1/UbiB family)
MVKRESQYYDFTYFERKPLAVGSMAQIHRAKIRLQNKILSIIVRFIKPGISARLEEDREILTSIAREIDRHPVYISTGNPKLSPLIGDIVQTAVVELHQPTAIDLQTAATRAYASEKRIEGKDFAIIFQTRAPAVLAHRPGSQFMIQEMVFGQSIRSFAERWGKLYPNIEQKIIESIAEKWIVTLLFGSGLYHSDLHPGNFLVDIKDGVVTANLLDYGKGGHISREMQNRILYLGLAVRARDPRVIADALWGISDKNKNQIDFLLLRMLIEYESLVARSHNLEMDFGRWTAWALNNGLVLPYDLISMNRGQLTINENLQRYRSRFDLGDFAIKYAERHPFEVYDRLVNELKIPTYIFLKAARVPILERIGKQLSRRQNLCDPAL